MYAAGLLPEAVAPQVVCDSVRVPVQPLGGARVILAVQLDLQPRASVTVTV